MDEQRGGASEGQSGTGEKKRILIVDDEKDFVSAVRDRLEYEGYEVLAAPDGLAGLEILNTTAVDLILLDLMMPRMGGVAFYQALKDDSGGRPPPVIAVTAFAHTLKGREIESLDGIPILDKPHRVDALLQAIRDSLLN